MRTKHFITLLLLTVAISGCLKKEAFYNPLEQKIISPEDYKNLPAEEKKEWEAVVTTEIEPETRAEIDTVVADVKETHDVFSPYLPEPVRLPVAAAVGIGTILWQIIRKKRISLGAKITARNLETIVKKKAPEAWAVFTKAQKADSANTKAIMPDKI